MITLTINIDKIERHTEILKKIINATIAIKEYELVDLLIIKDVVEQELIQRGYL